MDSKIPRVYAGPPWLLGGVFAVCCFAMTVTLITNEVYFWAIVFAVFGLWLTYLSYLAITQPWAEDEGDDDDNASPEETKSEPEQLSAEERAIRNIMDRPH
jgi:Ca2+/Na+ antiporter